MIDDLVSPVSHAVWCRYSFAEGDQKNRILFSNPASTKHRERMTVKLSYDEGQTWPVARLLYSGYSSYSDMAVTHDKTILCVYHNSKNHNGSWPTKLTLARFNLAWLTDAEERSETPEDRNP